MHTDRSDGRYSPDEVIKRCFDGNLDVVAITDHDLATPLPTGVHHRGEQQLTVLGGAEISGQHEGQELHLLVYFPRDIPKDFVAFCERQSQERAQRYQTALERLDLPQSLSPSDEAMRGHRALTRHHLARHLVASGRASDLRDAFATYIDHRHGNIPKIQLPFVEAIRQARAFGGVTSWAHPPTRHLDAFLDDFVSAGLQGLEGLRPHMSPKNRKTIRNRARRCKLFMTGGSDWHGWRDADPGLFWVDRYDLKGFLGALQAVA
jgi:hypothetical protein